MNAYYNDNDPFCAAWLRRLIAAGAIPGGYVDERSIAEVEPEDLRGFRHCHFFAGIGGFAYALQLAGWDMDRPIWTGSAPCQPFSSAGRQGGALDERHLWPRWLRLIRQCRPDTIIGEQVAGAIGFGWIDRVSADLEEEKYACGAAVLGAHSVGAPHIRQRLFWVAHAADAGWRARAGKECAAESRAALAYNGGATGWLADAERDGGRTDLAQRRPQGRIADFWASSVWLGCLGGKARRVEPSIQPLATGISNRVGLLRGSGNAITPQAAAKFIQAVMECIP